MRAFPSLNCSLGPYWLKHGGA